MARCGVKARIIDKRSRKVFVGHADGLRPRTLEIFDTMGFQYKVIAEGAGFASFCIWVSLIYLAKRSMLIYLCMSGSRRQRRSNVSIQDTSGPYDDLALSCYALGSGAH